MFVFIIDHVITGRICTFGFQYFIELIAFVSAWRHAGVGCCLRGIRDNAGRRKVGYSWLSVLCVLSWGLRGADRRGSGIGILSWLIGLVRRKSFDLCGWRVI